MKKRSWKNEACGFINFEVIIKKPRWNVIKDHIPPTKGSITSKNIEISLRKLTHSRKPNCWRFVESFKWIADMTWEESFTKTLTTWKHRFSRSKMRLIYYFKTPAAYVQNIDSRITSTQHIESLAKTKPFLIIFILKSFLSYLVHSCFTFRKYVTTIECLWKYSNHCLLFWKGNIFLILLSKYLENTGRFIILVFKCYYLKKIARANLDTLGRKNN